jgi:hypothetical protein
MRFEISFELKRSVFVRECAIPNELPWHELGGVRGLAGIVIQDPLSKIGGDTSVFLGAAGDAA